MTIPLPGNRELSVRRRYLWPYRFRYYGAPMRTNGWTILVPFLSIHYVGA